MILDAQNLFSDGQAVTVAAVSTNSIDLGPALGQNLGVGENIYLVVSVAVALTNGGGGTGVDVYLMDDSDAALATTPANLIVVGQLSSTAAAGTRLVFRLQPDLIGTQRFLGLNYDPTGANLTGGNIDAFLTKDIAAFTPYADNIFIG